MAMDYAQRQRDPARHAVGIAFVVAVHVLVIYALITGLGTKAIEVIKKPLNATIIEEVKLPPPPPPPPPPPRKMIEPPKVQPLETYVPPPDIPPPVQSTAPVITAVTPTPPPEPHVIQPPPVVAMPAPAPKPYVRRGVACNQIEKPTFPRDAIRAGVQKGRVEARLSIDEKGNVTAVDITSSEPPRVFDKVVKGALETWKCEADGSKYVGVVEVNFSLKDE